MGVFLISDMLLALGCVCDIEPRMTFGPVGKSARYRSFGSKGEKQVIKNLP